MSYSTDRANLLADQLSRFVTLNAAQLAGQVANLDFWLSEVRHALRILDEYGTRFVRLEAGQQRYILSNRIEEVVQGNDGIARRVVPPVRRAPHQELQKARKILLGSVTRFLSRCKQEGLVADAEFHE